MRRAAQVGVGGSRKIRGLLPSGVSFSVGLEYAEFLRNEDGSKSLAMMPIVRLRGEFQSASGARLFDLDLGTLESDQRPETFDKIRSVLDEAEDQLGILFMAFEARRKQQEDEREDHSAEG